LSNAMCSRLEELGGKVITSATVTEIISSQGKIEGVRLADGRTFTAPAVIAGCHPKVALEMVTPGEMPAHLLTRVAMAPANAKGSGPLKVDVALDGLLSVPRYEAIRGDGIDLRKTVLLIGTEDAVLESFAACERREVPRHPYITLAVPSAADPTQRPPARTSYMSIRQSCLSTPVQAGMR